MESKSTLWLLWKLLITCASTKVTVTCTCRKKISRILNLIIILVNRQFYHCIETANVKVTISDLCLILIGSPSVQCRGGTSVSTMCTDS